MYNVYLIDEDGRHSAPVAVCQDEDEARSLSSQLVTQLEKASYINLTDVPHPTGVGFNKAENFFPVRWGYVGDTDDLALQSH